MARSLALFLAGAASALVVAGFVLEPPQAGRAAVAERSENRDGIPEAAADVETSRDAIGVPPSRATGVARGDSASARRQAFARTLRDLQRSQPQIEPTQANARHGDPRIEARVILDGMLAGFDQEVAQQAAPDQGDRSR